MMNSNFTLRIDTSVTLEELDQLFASIGWRCRGAAKWREVLSKSSFTCSCWEKNQLIGFGRILEDGVM